MSKALSAILFFIALWTCAFGIIMLIVIARDVL